MIWRYLRMLVVLVLLARIEGFASDRSTALDKRKATRNDAYLAAKSAAATNSSIEFAVALGKASFDLADLEDSKDSKIAIAQTGIAACERGLAAEASSGELHYYLAENLGQLAQTKKMGALPLLRQMEDHWQKALMLTPGTDFAGPDRSLGLLYDQAPGWPMSIGSKSKSRQHLEHAVVLAPDFPENHLTLIEVLVKWKEMGRAREAMAALNKLWDGARTKYSGPKWESDWEDWEKRKKKLTSALGE